MRISDWSSDVCSSDLWRPPVAPECQPPCGAEKMCASRCVLIGRLKAFGPGSELGVARLRFKSRVPKNELAPMLGDRDVTFLTYMQPSLPSRRGSTRRADARSEERRVGNKDGSTWKMRWSRDH